MVMKQNEWQKWAPFPDPRTGGYLSAPFGPGVYEMRNRATGELVLVGISKNVARRMSSLVPGPLGSGTRKNTRKRLYVLNCLSDLDYRTKACDNRGDAEIIERSLKDSNKYMFHT